MNPWIRRLAMMLGILVPGLALISLQVSPVLILAVLALAAIAILFAAGSITLAELKGLRRGAPRRSAAEPAGTAKSEAGTLVPHSAGIVSHLRQVPGALRDLAGLLRGQRLSPREEDSRMDAIDRVLDRTITRSRGTSAPATVRRPSSREARGGPGGSGGDPFQDLLETDFEPTLLDVEMPEIEGAGPDLTLNSDIGMTALRSRVAGKEGAGTGQGPGVPAGKAAAARGPAAVPPAVAARMVEFPEGGALDIPPGLGEEIPRSLPTIDKNGKIPPRPAGMIPRPTLTVPGTPEAGAPVPVQEIKAPAPLGGQEMISFTAEPGGSMDDLLAALKADAVRVKRSDDSSLLRNLKGVRVQGKELVDELSALLKQLR